MNVSCIWQLFIPSDSLIQCYILNQGVFCFSSVVATLFLCFIFCFKKQKYIVYPQTMLLNDVNASCSGKLVI